MAIPYNTTVAGTSIRDALDLHLRIKHAGAWQSCEDVQVKHSGAWRDTKEVYVKSGGTWRLVHEGEHFLFNVEVTGSNNGEFQLANWISTTGGYSGNEFDDFHSNSEPTTISVPKAATKRLESSIAMYMPAQVSVGQASQYGEVELGAFTAQAVSAAADLNESGLRKAFDTEV